MMGVTISSSHVLKKDSVLEVAMGRCWDDGKGIITDIVDEVEKDTGDVEDITYLVCDVGGVTDVMGDNGEVPNVIPDIWEMAGMSRISWEMSGA